MNQVLVVGAAGRRSQVIDQGLEGAAVQVVRKRWLSFLRARRSSVPALVIYDLAGLNTPQPDVLSQLPASMPETGVLYLAGKNATGLDGLDSVLQQPNVDFILDTSDPRELRLRANRLLARRLEPINTSQEIRNEATVDLPAVLLHIVPKLHASTGRLDAREVSALYGISLAALSRSLGRSEQSVHKTPTAQGIQTGLSLYERIAAILLRLTGTETGLRTWMQASNPELEGETPISLLLNGEGKVVEELLESILRGEPA